MTTKSSHGQSPMAVPDPARPVASVSTEVVVRTARRHFSEAYRTRILEEADACVAPGQVGALLRREGLYSSLLTLWRRKRLQPSSRPARSKGLEARTHRMLALERENRALRARNHRVEIMLDIQKKISEILQIPLNPGDKERTGS